MSIPLQSPLPRSTPSDDESALEHLEHELSPHYNGPNLPANIESIEPKATTPPASALTKHAQIHGYLAVFSILGTLARLGLTALCAYHGAPIGGSASGSVVWANFAGSAAMGFLVENATMFVGPGGGKAATLPLYTGLTTGFCGSLTSFSAFEYAAFTYMADVSPPSPGGPSRRGEKFLALVAYLILTVCLSLAALQFGAHVATATRRLLPPFPAPLLEMLNYAVVPVAAASWIGAAVMAVFIPRWRGAALLACVFSPLGSFSRFWISRRLNPLVKAFPLGTFTSNLVASLVLPGMHIGMARYAGSGCDVLKGVGDGFCGCLSTVSTFVVELRGLRVCSAYVYGSVSILAGLIAMVVVLGSWTWSHGGLVAFC